MALQSLNSTFIYRHLNRSNAVTTAIAALMDKGEILSTKNMEEAFMIIMKNFKFPLKFKVMEAVNSGKIQMRYSKTIAKLPTCLPFFLYKNGNDICAVVGIDIYGTYDDETSNVRIDAKKLYCMLEGAYLAIVAFEHQNQLVGKTITLSSGSEIYSSMFTKVLNKKYSLNIDKTKLHKVIYLSSKFYMINILGLKDSDMISNYAFKNCANGNQFSIAEADDIFPQEGYTNLETFINGLKTIELNLGMKDLTVRGYLESYINMYDSSNLLSLECFPYFMYNILSVIDGGYINNQYVLEGIVGDNGAKMYQNIVDLDK